MAGQSDIDLIAVVSRPLSRRQKLTIADRLSQRSLPCPTRGLELVFYSEDGLRDRSGAGFELNLNTGPRMVERVSTDPREEPRFWFLLDRAIAKERALTLVGPSGRQVFPEIPRATSLQALQESLAWHRTRDGADSDAVLNACRSWRFAEQDVWSSKLEAGEWARRRMDDPAVADWALAVRRGQGPPPPEDAISRLLEEVEKRIAAERARSLA